MYKDTSIKRKPGTVVKFLWFRECRVKTAINLLETERKQETMSGILIVIFSLYNFLPR
jgi:hypothetical protein